MDFRIEDNQQDRVQEDQRRDRQRAESHAAVRFKQAMAGAQVRTPLHPQTKEAQKAHLKDGKFHLAEESGKKELPIR